MTFAREKYTWHLAGYTEENYWTIEEKEILRYLDEAIAPWESKPDAWAQQLHQHMDAQAQVGMSHIF